MLTTLCAGKGSNDYVFTRDDGTPVRDFRGAWQNMCIRAAVRCRDGTISRFECRKCGAPMDAGTRICSVKTKDADGYERKCGGEHRYIGLLVHDMRRSAAKRLRESSIHEKLIMDIGGWKTRSMFDFYTITDPEAMRRGMEAVTAPVLSYSHQIAPDGQNAGRAGKLAVQ